MMMMMMMTIAILTSINHMFVVIGGCSRYVKVPDETECDALSASSSQKSSDSSLNITGRSVTPLELVATRDAVFFNV